MVFWVRFLTTTVVQKLLVGICCLHQAVSLDCFSGHTVGWSSASSETCSPCVWSQRCVCSTPTLDPPDPSSHVFSRERLAGSAMGASAGQGAEEAARRPLLPPPPTPARTCSGGWVLPPRPQLSLWPGQRCWPASTTLGPSSSLHFLLDHETPRLGVASFPYLEH